MDDWRAIADRCCDCNESGKVDCATDADAEIKSAMLALADIILRDCEELYGGELCVQNCDVGDVHGDIDACVL